MHEVFATLQRFDGMCLLRSLESLTSMSWRKHLGNSFPFRPMLQHQGCQGLVSRAWDGLSHRLNEAYALLTWRLQKSRPQTMPGRPQTVQGRPPPTPPFLARCETQTAELPLRNIKLQATCRPFDSTPPQSHTLSLFELLPRGFAELGSQSGRTRGPQLDAGGSEAFR